MPEITILTDGADVRIIYPLAGESPDDFRRRMGVMGQVLSQLAPGTVSVILDAAPTCPVCVVTSPRSLDNRSPAEPE